MRHQHLFAGDVLYGRGDLARHDKRIRRVRVIVGRTADVAPPVDVVEVGLHAGQPQALEQRVAPRLGVHL